jgi:hypothetical protein
MKVRINFIKAPLLHYVGNIISGLFGILDNLIMVLSLGTISTTFTMGWLITRMGTIFYGYKPKQQTH